MQGVLLKWLWRPVGLEHVALEIEFAIHSWEYVISSAHPVADIAIVCLYCEARTVIPQRLHSSY